MKDADLMLMSDWSNLGTGFVLYQISCKCMETEDPDVKNYKSGCCENGWKLIMAGGRYNTECESHYSPVEGELLGIANALHKSRYLTHGAIRLTVLTDHKPLVRFLNFNAIQEIENR
jgi:hypothetical protein